MEHLFMDLYSSGGATSLTITGNFSKFAQAIPLTASWSTRVTGALVHVISVLGLLNKITTDSHPKLDNDVITKICTSHNIFIHFTTPYNSNLNSPVERFYSTVEGRTTLKQDTIQTLMKYSLIAFNKQYYICMYIY